MGNQIITLELIQGNPGGANGLQWGFNGGRNQLQTCILHPRINEFEMGTNLDRFNPPDFHELKGNFPAFKYIGPPTHFPWETVLKSSLNPLLIASFVTLGADITEVWWHLT